MESGSPPTFRFGPFVLDVARARLTRGGAPVALRPKAFALLSYLVAHPGRVLGKDELLRAVWPGVVVNDESLSQCVRELRAALGDERLIQTVPRRGYLFDAAVVDAGAPAARAPVRWRGAAIALTLALLLLVAGGAAFVAQRSGDSPANPLAPRSIAVLPFAPADGDPFADALAEDLSDALALLPNTRVIAFASAAAVARRDADPQRIGRQLGVRHLLAGSVQREGARVRIDARLVSADDGSTLWSQSFDYPDIESWNWQRDIVPRVARSIDVPPPGTVPPIEWKGRQLVAIEAVLAGQRELRLATHLAGLRRARSLFEHALAIEPDSPSALTGLARAYLEEAERGWSQDRDGALAQSEQAVARALEIAPEHVSAVDVQTRLLGARGDLDAALAGHQIALAYHPSSAWSHARIAHLKLRLGRPEEVAAHADMALRLSPFEPALVGYVQLWAGIADFYLDREDAAYERLRQAADAGAYAVRFGALLWLASLDALHGRPQDAARHAAAVMALDPSWTIAKWRPRTQLTHPRLASGRERFAEGLRLAGLPQ